MDIDGVPDLGNVVNYEEVGALSQRRIIAFFNEFVGQTVLFLNKFSAECEEKLFMVDTRLEKLETMLSILEAKLSSVPELASSVTTNGESAHSAEPAQSNNAAPAPASDSQSTVTEPTNGQSAAPSQPNGDQSAAGASDPAPGQVPLRQTEPYRRYFRMLEVGVPEPAVRMKMQQEGVDPDALQRGDKLVSDGTAVEAGRRRDSRSEESDAPSWESESS